MEAEHGDVVDLGVAVHPLADAEFEAGALFLDREVTDVVDPLLDSGVLEALAGTAVLLESAELVLEAVGADVEGVATLDGEGDSLEGEAGGNLVTVADATLDSLEFGEGVGMTEVDGAAG